MSFKNVEIKNIFTKGKYLVLNLLNVNKFFSTVLFPLIMLIVYLVSIFFFISKEFEILDGVTFVYVRRSLIYLNVLAIVSLIYFFLLLIFKKDEKFSFKNSTEKIFEGEIFFILLPLTPVIQYVINNQNYLTPTGSLLVILFFILFSGIFILLLPAIFRFVSSTRVMIPLGLAFSFSITSMAMLSQYFSWFEIGSLKIQWLVFCLVYLVTWFLIFLNEKKLLVLLITVFFITNTVSQVMSNVEWKSDNTSLEYSENQLISLVRNRIPESTPNIYLLVYDAYVPNETMLGYGINNILQEDYLTEMNFTLYPHTYSIGDSTLRTMSPVLNASDEYYGSTRRAVSGDGVVHNAFKSLGYKTYGIFTSAYFFLENPPKYDFYIPEYQSPTPVIIKAILMGEFRFDIEFNKFPKAEFFETKQKIFEESSKFPKFVYMHTNRPNHSQNSGACRSDEISLFNDRLSTANSEMKQDVQKIIDNDPNAIIIVAGDHGPYLTKNCTGLTSDIDVSEISRLDIQDRFGTFLAIRGPSKNFEEYDNITVLQDLFPIIFAYLFDDDAFLDFNIEPNANVYPAYDDSPDVNIDRITIEDGIINGGIDNGEPLFISPSASQ